MVAIASNWLTTESDPGIESVISDIAAVIGQPVLRRGIVNAVITYWNPAAAWLYGWSEAEALGKVAHELLATRFPVPLEEIDRQVAATGAWNGRLVHLAKDGTRISVAAFWTAQEGRFGEVESIVELCIPSGSSAGLIRTGDRNRRERAEAAQARGDIALTAANRELEAFAYAVSHDLRAPLRHIDGFSSALAEDFGELLPEAGLEYLSAVRAAAQQMGELIDDMLALSRVTRVELCRSSLDLSALASTAAADTQRESPKRPVKWVIEPGLRADADAGLLMVVLRNLFANAWKFTAKHRSARIEFSAVQTAAETAYLVRDDGAGFDIRHAEKLFLPFQRLHRVADFPGTGIGLATVHRIITRHGGRVWAEGKVEQGASIYFTLPAAPGQGDRQ